jgi:hypothetical protein
MSIITAEEVRSAILADKPRNEDKMLTMAEDPEIGDWFFLESTETIYRYGLPSAGWQSITIDELKEKQGGARYLPCNH